MELATLTDFFEALTIFCFGLSWPISIRKSKPGIRAICLIMRPSISEQKRPIAIKLRASTTYVLNNLPIADFDFVMAAFLLEEQK